MNKYQLDNINLRKIVQEKKENLVSLFTIS
jgi:hypothetical protein